MDPGIYEFCLLKSSSAAWSPPLFFRSGDCKTFIFKARRKTVSGDQKEEGGS